MTRNGNPRRSTNFFDDKVNPERWKAVTIIPQKSHGEFLQGSGVNISSELLKNRHATTGTIVQKYGQGSLVDYYLVRHDQENSEPEFAVYHRSEMTPKINPGG